LEAFDFQAMHVSVVIY